MKTTSTTAAIKDMTPEQLKDRALSIKILTHWVGRVKSLTKESGTYTPATTELLNKKNAELALIRREYLDQTGTPLPE